MKPKRLISLLVAVCMMITMLPLSAVTAFAADIPALGKDEFDYQGLRYKKLSSSTVSVVGPVESGMVTLKFLKKSLIIVSKYILLRKLQRVRFMAMVSTKRKLTVLKN